jgi:hypothetical protein
MTIIRKPFTSQYGFSSPGFEVDAQGNIIATSIVAAGAVGGIGASDYAVTDEPGYFIINNSGQQNSALAVTRNTRFTFTLDLSEYTFSIFTDAAGTTLYSTGLSHTSVDGVLTSAAAAQGKSTGSLLLTVAPGAPNTLYYGDATAGIIGTINVADASGLFGELSVSGTTQSTSITSGALVVAGGAGIQKNLSVGGYITTDGLDIDGVGVANITSTTNLELDAANRIIIKNDNLFLGEINSTGLSIPINNSSISVSTINSTSIGAVTPSTAAFTSATVSQTPTAITGVANKYYVDKTATALAIAFGL